MKLFFTLFLLILVSCNVLTNSATSPATSKSVIFLNSRDEESLYDFLTYIDSYNKKCTLLEISIKEKGNYYPVGIGLKEHNNRNIKLDVAKKIAKIYKVDYENSDVFLSKFYLKTAMISVSESMLDQLKNKGYEVFVLRKN